MAREVLLVEGAATLVAVIAMAAAVSVSHAVVLRDMSGVPAGAVVVVPSGAAIAPTVSPTPLPAASVAAVVVPAPAPLDIAASDSLQVVPQQVPVGPTLSTAPGRSDERSTPQTPAQAGSPSGHDSPKPSSGFEKEQSRVFPDRD